MWTLASSMKTLSTIDQSKSLISKTSLGESMLRSATTRINSITSKRNFSLNSEKPFNINSFEELIEFKQANQ